MNDNYEEALAEFLPPWATGKASGWTDIGAQLRTKDGRRIGNAVLIGSEQQQGLTFYQLVTDVGTLVHFTEREIAELALLRVQDFLHERGMELSEEKTRIVHIDEGFDFLGQTVRKYNGKYLTRPSKKSCKALSTKVRATIQANKTAKQENLIGLLNPIIRGWGNYHRFSAASDTFSKMDNQIWIKIWRWCKRRHPNKMTTWVQKRYFPSLPGLRKWDFTAKGRKGPMTLQKLNRLPVERHTKIKGEANPYDPAWADYFDRLLFDRMVTQLQGRQKLISIWKRQQGICPVCNTKITSETGWHLHHLVPRHKGGGDNPANLIFLHPNCHRQTHNGSTSDVWADEAHHDGQSI